MTNKHRTNIVSAHTPKQFALTLAKQAGAIITKYFFMDHQREIKADHSPVTIADKTINQLVADSIKKQFPAHGFIGEEGGSYGEKNEFVWICDPLDGTLAFTHHIPTCVFSLALLQRGVPVLGIIHDPFLKRLYYAEKNRGTFLNGKRIHVSGDKTLKNKLLGVAAWRKARYDITSIYPTLDDAGAVAFSLGCIMYSGMLVASGEFVGTIFPHDSPWDVAPMKIIVEEAGGRVTDIFGHDQKYNQPIKGGVISNGPVHRQLIEIISQVLKNNSITKKG